MPKILAARRLRACAKILVVWCGLGVAIQPAHAAPAPKTHSVAIEALNVQQAGALTRQLIAARRYEDARRLARLWQPSDPAIAVRIAFTEGLIAAAQGDHMAAVVQYRSILAKDPNSDLVRYAMTQSMAALGDVDGVRAQTRFLVQSGLDEHLGGDVSRLLSRTEQARPLQFRGFASVLPSSNINGGTDNDTVDIGGVGFAISPDARRKSGLGFLLGGEVSYRQTLTPNWAFISTARLTGRFYPSIDMEQVTLDASTGLAARFGPARASLAATFSSDVTDAHHVSNTFGLRGELQSPIGPDWTLYVSPFVSHQDYADSDAKDGITFGITAHAEYSLGRNHFVRFIGAVEAARLTSDRFSYDEALLGAGYNSELPLGITVYVQADVALRGYKDIYPGLNERQRDTRLGFSATLTKRDLDVLGLAPRLNYRFERNFSNAAFSDRTTHTVDVRLTAEF